MAAGLADYARPAEKLSLTQSTALTATGLLVYHCLQFVCKFHHISNAML